MTDVRNYRVKAIRRIVTPIKGAVVEPGTEGTLSADGKVRWAGLDLWPLDAAEDVDYAILGPAPAPPPKPPVELTAVVRERMCQEKAAAVREKFDQCCAMAAGGIDFSRHWEDAMRAQVEFLAELNRVKGLPW